MIREKSNNPGAGNPSRPLAQTPQQEYYFNKKDIILNICLLFPGQGAQYPGMGEDLHKVSKNVQQLFEEASEIGGKDYQKLLFQGTEEELRSTDNTQIAITLVNAAASIVLEERGIVPQVCAGFSLGEYTALHQAGILSRSDLLRLVKIRGEVMEEASRQLDSSQGAPGMMAVLGLDREEVEAVLAGIEEDVFVANYNSSSQIVLAGTFQGLAAAEKKLYEAEAMKIVRLKVSGPFHSPLMLEARNIFAETVNKTPFADPKIPVFANVSGQVLKSGEEARLSCLDQLVNPVRWVGCEEGILKTSPDQILEAGPGSVLSGLWKTLRSGLRCYPAGTIEGINRSQERKEIPQ